MQDASLYSIKTYYIEFALEWMKRDLFAITSSFATLCSIIAFNHQNIFLTLSSLGNIVLSCVISKRKLTISDTKTITIIGGFLYLLGLLISKILSFDTVSLYLFIASQLFLSNPDKSIKEMFINIKMGSFSIVLGCYFGYILFPLNSCDLITKPPVSNLLMSFAFSALYFILTTIKKENKRIY
eukprot:GHVP01063034.1.p1 GENE.GHVP01063034.1~~GHVP01063034.1.p1  ORF type:complete len:183 (-),score=5.99 GHVP01063034.1:9-557(-)